MKNLIVSFVILLSLLQSGCATTYVVPSGSPTAKLRFKYDHQGIQQVSGSVALARVDLTSCSQDGRYERQIVLEITKDDPFKFNKKETSPIKMIGTSTVAEENIREGLIEGGKLFPFDIYSVYLGFGQGLVPRYSCVIYGSFTPEPSSEYEIENLNSIKSNGGECSAKIYKLNLGPRGEVVRKLDPTQRYYRREDFCQAR